MADEALLEPLKAYNMLYKDRFKEEAENFFEQMKDKSGINVELNRETIKQIKKLEEQKALLEKKRGGSRRLKGLIIFFIVLLGITAIVMPILGVNKLVGIPAAIVSAVLAVGLIVALIIIIVKILNSKIKSLNDSLADLLAKIAALRSEAEKQMYPLNSLYDWNMAAVIVENVIPTLDFDQYFDGRKHALLVDKYGFGKDDERDLSAIYVQSGNILGNPFLIQKAKIHEIVDKTYTGSITISWTETRHDEKGNSYTVTRTQTLTATTTHPAPEYSYETSLIYGNPAAPDLVFSRKPQGMAGKSEKELYKFVRKEEKELASLAEKSIKKGGNFTPLANTEFEALFHAWNRNNEQQFRLLFTPLAQNNEVDLVTKTDGYGDDFYFVKNKLINTISSRHSQTFDYSGNPMDYYDIDYDEAKRKFVNYVCAFAKGFYFDMAPLMAIPLYQQMKSLEYIYGKDCPSNYSYFEHEVMANSFTEDTFAHEDTTTDVLLKTKVLRKDGNADKVLVKAFSYKGEPRVDYVSKLGGDGRWHEVPVHWTEYIPLERESTMEVANTNASRFDFNDKINNNGFSDFIRKHSIDGIYSFRRGLLAILGAERYDNSADSEMDSYFHKEEK